MPASTINSPELTNDQVQAILVQPLMAASVFLAAGPRIFDTNGSPPHRRTRPRRPPHRQRPPGGAAVIRLTLVAARITGLLAAVVVVLAVPPDASTTAFTPPASSQPENSPTRPDTTGDRAAGRVLQQMQLVLLDSR